jgi:hypothetical protein
LMSTSRKKIEKGLPNQRRFHWTQMLTSSGRYYPGQTLRTGARNI